MITGGNLDETQMVAVATLAGKHRLVVVEGAAGAGKTTPLAGTRTVIAQTGHRMIVVTPTLKAAQVVAIEVGSQAHSAAWLARQYGFSWDNDGRWTRELSVPFSDALLCRGDLLLIDEAGMLDQDTARALVTIADETGARLALVGDRHQLPAVGRGGVLDLAAHWAGPDASLTLDNVHRFADPDYAKLSLAMRSAENPEAVFDLLVQRGQIVVHSDETSRTAALADDAAATGALVVADTREQVADLNQAIRERLVTADRSTTPACSSPTVVSESGSATESLPGATTTTSASPTATPGSSPRCATTAPCISSGRRARGSFRSGTPSPTSNSPTLRPPTGPKARPPEPPTWLSANTPVRHRPTSP
jgi:ATP-dependent exoDNAse (exonuclease V) alpha subunit